MSKEPKTVREALNTMAAGVESCIEGEDQTIDIYQESAEINQALKEIEAIIRESKPEESYYNTYGEPISDTGVNMVHAFNQASNQYQETLLSKLGDKK